MLCIKNIWWFKCFVSTEVQNMAMNIKWKGSKLSEENNVQFSASLDWFKGTGNFDTCLLEDFFDEDFDLVSVYIVLDHRMAILYLNLQRREYLIYEWAWFSQKF